MKYETKGRKQKTVGNDPVLPNREQSHPLRRRKKGIRPNTP